ncbi:ATP-dependent nuclease [Candidatus Galacturonibacter soehngenii]|uniref:AAA family ATPase n=1 Tax=Candidatus Galacturonatibacter soehngenii TaxID=2307010 RepID=A0A7V7UC64_9FIRM|nr:AAA family ATPase [Candidatus Galacturonibacter soehngenii]KAB1438605.1 AAA family ATPase [Candidatus Galacturonibacter soehngenii]MBA4685633.1 AAA family ATPase [Candidatus Galacturonibacter soehngenii]
MKIAAISIENFKSIKKLTISEIDNAMILVGKNNTGKTVVLDALLALFDSYEIKERHFFSKNQNIEIAVTLSLDEDDLTHLNEKGAVSRYKRYDIWEKDFMSKLPSYSKEEGLIKFTCIINRDGKRRYFDGFKKDNKYILEVLPKIHYLNSRRDLSNIQADIFSFQGNKALESLRYDKCMFDGKKPCSRCFECVGMMQKKKTDELTITETARLLEYKLFTTNIEEFESRINYYFHKNNGEAQNIKYVMNFDFDRLLSMDTLIDNKERGTIGTIDNLGAGTRSIYIFSMLEAYIERDNSVNSIILIEEPEIYLHPQLQKVASEILFRLSKKNQVIFSTHSPNMLFNFSTRQIKQVIADEDYNTTIKEDVDIDIILDDLGYTANDLMNVSFVFIVEGKQDGNRLPMLLEKYYSEIYDEKGMLKRISIIPTNSCTNIKTYANLKYINKLYLKDQFLMIRDSDGKNPKHLVRQLCSYYSERAKQDVGNVPKVEPRNVLVLKYYSFENYFLDPSVMCKIGVIKSEEEFYNILYDKYRSYLYKLPSMKRMIKITGTRIKSKEDLKKNMEFLRIYVRGHNLFDIFYGKYKGDAQTQILKKYIDVAPKENFSNILDAIDRFVYFESRKKETLD